MLEQLWMVASHICIYQIGMQKLLDVVICYLISGNDKPNLHLWMLDNVCVCVLREYVIIGALAWGVLGSTLLGQGTVILVHWV